MESILIISLSMKRINASNIFNNLFQRDIRVGNMETLLFEGGFTFFDCRLTNLIDVDEGGIGHFQTHEHAQPDVFFLEVGVLQTQVPHEIVILLIDEFLQFRPRPFHTLLLFVTRRLSMNRFEALHQTLLHLGLGKNLLRVVWRKRWLLQHKRCIIRII